MKNVLWLMQFAPHYREDLLRELGRICNLTVCCPPCSRYGLVEPSARQGYEYIELQPNSFLEKLGVVVPKGERQVLKRPWDVVICVEDMHFPVRYFDYFLWLLSRGNRPKWLWWGHFRGRRSWKILQYARRFLVNSSSGTFTYTEKVKDELVSWGCDASKLVSLNNSEVYRSQIAPRVLPTLEGRLRLLFVGRPEPEKRIERVIELVERLDVLDARLIGPTMSRYSDMVREKNLADRIDLCEAKTGNALEEDFEWCHVVVNPGTLGLLVINAARYGRAVIVDRDSRHGPEIVVAEETGQFIIDWSDQQELDAFFLGLLEREDQLRERGQQLSAYVQSNYTIEKMVERFAIHCT